MDVRFSPEQEALRDSAVRVVDRLGVHTVADLHDAERAAKVDAAIRAAGWRELRVAAAGEATRWASGVEVAIVAEELGRALVDAPFAGPTLAADLRRRAGAPAASGDETVVLDRTLGALAVAAPGRDDGAIAFDAGVSTSGLLAGPDDELVSVPLDGERIAVDLTRPSVRITAAGGAPVAAARRPIDANAQRRWTALALALTCADLVGVMRGAIALTTGYASERRQYGVPVGSFQAVQHLLADALVAAEGASSVTRHAAWAVDALAPSDALAAGAVAKAYCSRAARTVCETAIQVHGGIGNTWDCLAHVYLRRAVLSIDVLGGVGPSLARVITHHGIGDGDGLR